MCSDSMTPFYVKVSGAFNRYFPYLIFLHIVQMVRNSRQIFSAVENAGNCSIKLNAMLLEAPCAMLSHLEISFVVNMQQKRKGYFFELLYGNNVGYL